MLSISIAILSVICALAVYAAMVLVKQKQLRDRLIRSLWTKGYSKGYIANAVGVTRKKVTEVLSNNNHYGC
jgi:hypothetical protein